MKKLIAILAILFCASAAQALTVKLVFEWDANDEPDLAGYRLYTSTTSGQYTRGQYLLSTDQVTTCEDIIDIEPGEVVYYVLTAFDLDGDESGFSNEVNFFLPNQGPGLPPASPAFRLKSWAVVSSE
jgi:hypothetical protein